MATYKVTFRKRYDAEAKPADDPASFVQAPDGVVLNAMVAEQIEPPAVHPQEVLDEDDAFLSIGTEVWEYEVADDRKDDFITALENSRMVLEYEEVDDVLGA